jgi:S-layer protein
MAITIPQQTEILKVVAGLFNAAPGGSNLTELAKLFEGGMTGSQLADGLASSTLFTNGVLAGKVTVESQVSVLMKNFGLVADEADPTSAGSQAHEYFHQQLEAKVGFGQIVYNAITFLSTTTDPKFLIAKTLQDNKVLVSAAYSETTSSSDLSTLQKVLSNVTGTAAYTPADVAKILEGITPTGGDTFTLTTGVDSGSAFTGGTGNDTFNGTTGSTTLTALDSLDGGAGTDTLNYIQTAAIAVPSSVSLKNIEALNFTSGADIALDASAWTGVTSLNAASTGGSDITVASDVNVTVTDTNQATGTINVDGAKNVTIDTAKVTTGDISVGTNTAVTGVVGITAQLIGGVGGGINVVGGTAVTATQNVKAGATATTSAVDVTNDGALTSVTSAVVKGTGATVTYNTVSVTGVADADSDDTITSVSVTGATSVALANLNKLTSLSLGTTSGNVILDNSAVGATDAATTLALAVNGVTGGTLDDADIIETLNITSSGTDSTLANITFGAVKNITLAGDKKLTLTSIAGATVLESIDAAAATGGMTINSALLTTTNFAGGAGADTITLGATTQAITTGAGDDTVILAATTTALGTGGTIDAGDGTGDVLTFADADDATTASGGTTFETKISGFEVVNLFGAAGAGVTVNVANLDDISKVNVAVDLGQTLAVSNIASGGTVTYEAAQTAASTITVANAATSTADTFNVGIISAAARNINSLTISNVETINFATDDTATTSTGIEHVASLTAAAATAINVSGDAGLTLTFTGTALTTFDASGVTDGDVTWTAGALAAAATVKGGATSDANVIVLSAVLDDITYTGGSGTDTITMNHATNHDATTNSFTLGNGTNTLTAGNNDGDNTVTGGTGVDTITVGNGDNTITTGDGNDIITVGTGANTISAGAGNDTITIGASAGTNTVDVGAGTEAIVFTGVQTAAGFYTSITGLGAGDTMDFSATANDGGGLTSAVLGAKITLGGASSFANYLDAATAGDGSTDSAFAWFQFNGNTYIALDNSAAATFQDGADQVVEITGLVNLATSTQDGSYVVTLV